MRLIKFLNNNSVVLLTTILLFVVGRIFLMDTYFFWDSTATLSIPAHFLYETRFTSLAFPAGMVNDNLFLSSLLALVWMLFGRNLFVTHLLFTGIGIVLIYQIYLLCRYFVKDRKVFPFIFLLLLSETALLTQSLLIMTDTVMVLFAVMAFRYILENKRIGLALSLLGLSLLRARGFFMCAGIGLAYYIYTLYSCGYKQPFRQLWKALLPFTPTLLVNLVLLLFRMSSGESYYYFDDNSPWAGHYQLVDIQGLLKNTMTVGRFFLDYGKVFIWLVLLVLLFKYGWRKIFNNETKPIWILFGGTLLGMLLVTLPISNEMGFRYFIFQYLLLGLAAGILLFKLLRIQYGRIVILFLIAGLWSAHFWVYPDKVSKGWDTTLAHLPYYELRKETINYIDKQEIDYASISFFFPSTAPARYIELNDDERRFAPLDLKKNKYVTYSNIANWSDELIDEVTQHWVPVKEFSKGRVFVRIYRNPELIENDDNCVQSSRLPSGDGGVILL